MSLLLEEPLNLGKSPLPSLGWIALIQEPGVSEAQGVQWLPEEPFGGWALG